MSVRLITGDCRDVLATLPAESVHCVVTSPPYWGLRDYGTAKWEGGDPVCDHIERPARKDQDAGRPTAGPNRGGSFRGGDIQFNRGCAKCGARRIDAQIGLESTYQEFIAEMVAVFREVRRVLRADGTLWLNLGDSYTTGASTAPRASDPKAVAEVSRGIPRIGTPLGLKPKDLCGIPWRVAFALQADGWWLRQDIIWSKPNPMPESVTDRCTKAHEYVFLLSKSERYYYDAEAIKEAAFGKNEHDLTGQGMFAPGQTPQRGNRKIKMPDGWDTGAGGHGSFHRNGREKGRTREVPPRHQAYESSDRSSLNDVGRGMLRNKRSVWEIPTSPFPEAHFATFPPALIEPCILAGCPKGGTVLDPFGGAGTTGLVADRLQRDAILIELNPAYAEMARRRIMGDAPLFTQAAE